MRFPMVVKMLAVGFTTLLLWAALGNISFLVDERRAYQAQAMQSVQQSHAGAQTLVGPVLQRRCTESWDVLVGEGKQQGSVAKIGGSQR